MGLSQEDIDRLLKQAKQDKRRFKGYSVSTREVDGKLVSSLEKNVAGKRGWANPGSTSVGGTSADVLLGNPAIVKRTPRERVASLTAKLMEAAKDPVQFSILMEKVQGQLWATGKPATAEDIQRLAQGLIHRAEMDQKAKT